MKAAQMNPASMPGVVVKDIPTPQPAADEILVRIHAAGVSSSDWMLRDGLGEGSASAAFAKLTFPLTLGWDFCGVIEAAGSDAVATVGAEIIGLMPKRGAMAEYGVLQPKLVARRPKGLSYAQSVTLVGPGMTAWFGVVVRGEVQEGQRVLIHAGAGSVGHLAVQLARNLGAHVTATASADNLDFVRGLGANEAIDYAAAPFEARGGEFDMVFDLVGGGVETRSWSVLKPGGVLVSALRAPPAGTIPSGRRGAFVGVAPSVQTLESLVALAEAGHIVPHVRSVHRLADVNRALDLARQGHGRGRLVIDTTG